MTTQQNSVITTNSDIDLDNFLVTVEDNQDVIIIDTCKNRIGVNTIDPSYSIDVRSRQDISGTIYTSCLKTGNIISSLIPHTDNPDMSHNLGSTNKSWKRIDASYIEISGVTIKDANQFTIGEGSGGAGIVFPSDISINGDICCNNIAVDGITINDANKFSIGEATNQSGITFPLDISINGNLTVTGTVNSTYLESLAQNTETELQYQFDNFETDSKIIAYNVDVSNIDVSNINIKENILFNNIAPKQDETIVYDGNNIKWKTRGENLVNYVENNVGNNIGLYKLGDDLRGTSINDWDYFGFTTAINHDGTRIAVSAPYDDSAGTDHGAVWFYNWNETTSTWDRVNIVYENSGETGPFLQMGVVGGEARLGWSMEMSNDGTHLIISAPFSDSDDNVGFIQILEYYTVDTSEYNQEGWHFKYRWNNRDDLSYNSNDPNPYWGWSVSINNDGRFIAFSGRGNETETNKGAVLVYEWNDDSSYVQLGNKIELDNTDMFGQAIQLSEPPNYISGVNNDSSGMRIVIGERNGKFYDGDGNVLTVGERGKVYVFEYSNSNWNQMNVLSGTSFEGSGTSGNNTWLGTSVAISKDGNLIAVGEPGYKTPRNDDTGIVHIYNYNIDSNGWGLLHSIDAPPLSNRFGSGGSQPDSVKLLSFSYDKSKFAIGNYNYNNTKGAVYIYQYNNNLNKYILSDSIKSTYGDDLCGHSAVLSGDGKKIIIGCRKYNSGQGRAQVWKLPENRLEYGLSYKLGSNIYGISGENANGDVLSPEENYIGNSVALSDNGKIMITGGAQTENGGDGRARIYVWSDISNDWFQQGPDINGIPNAKFGECVDVTGDGTRFVIGAGADHRWTEGSSTSAGSAQPGYFEVYDYNSSNNTYTLVGSRVKPKNVDNSLWGQQVAISKNGSRVVVSSPLHNWSGESGSAYGGFILYELINSTWTELGYVKGLQSYSFFGGNFRHGIGFSDDGNRICVGINRYDKTPSDSSTTFHGRVEVWEYDGVSSNESSRSDKFNLLKYFDGEYSGDQLGSSATISGNGKVIAAGSINYDNNDNNNYGAAYIWYEDNNGEWQSKGQTVPLRSDNDALDDGGVSEEPGQQMGAKNIKLSQDGNILIVNIPNTYTNVGSVICFEYIPSLDNWEDMKEFIGPTDRGTSSYFGSGFALTRDGSTLAIGAPRYDLYTYVNAGYIEVHDISNLKIKENTIYSKSDSDNKLRILPKKARQPPTITLLGDVNMSLSTSQVYIEPGAVATDYRGAILDVNIQGDTVSENPGKYIIEYNTTDYTGVTQYVFRNVIRDNTPFTRYIKSAQTTYGDLYLNLLTPHSQFSIDNYQGDDYDGILKTGPNPQIFKFVPVNAGFKITSNDLSGVGKFLGTANSQNLGHLLTLLDQDDSDVVTFTNIDLDSIGNIRFNISLDSGTFPTTYSIGSSHFDSAIVTDVFQITTINSDTSETKQLFNLLTTLPDYGFPTYRYIKSAQTTYGDMYLNLGDQMRPESYSYWLNTYGNNVNLTVYYKSLKIGTLPQLFKFVPVNGGFKITTAYGDGEGKFLGTSEERKEPNGNPAGHLLTLVDQNSPSVLIFTNIDLYNTSAINLKFKTHGMNFYGRTYYSGEGHFDFADYGDMLQLVETASGDNKNKVQILETL